MRGVKMNWLKKLLKSNKENKTIEYFPGNDLPVNKIFEAAIRANLESITMVGWTAEGELWLGSSYSKRKDIFWDMNLAARTVMDTRTVMDK